MAKPYVTLAILTQEYEEELFQSEALYFPEITRFHTQRDTAVFNARLNAAETLSNIQANAIHARLVPESIEVREFIITIEPPVRSAGWRSPVSLRMHAICASREDGYLTAFVPTLKIAVVTRRAAEFEEKIREEIISALRREGWTKSLEYLRRLERIRAVTLDFEEFGLDLKTPKQRAIAEMEDEDDEESVLDSATDDVAAMEFPPVFEADANIARLASFFNSAERASILLVGKPGVGKSSVYREMVRRREEFGLGDREFRETTGARLIAGQTGFGMWQERAAGLISEAAARNAVVHLGNLTEILEVGKTNASSQGMASFLRPKIARGEFIAVAECTPEQISFIERRDPNLLNAFQQISIEEPDETTSLRILRAVIDAATDSAQSHRDEVVRTTDAAHRRFSTYSAFPGRPVRFLRNLIRDAGAAEVTAADIFRAFSNETGIPEFLLNDAAALDLSETEEFFAGRVIGQPEAVSLVTNVIATVKAKLTQPRRPIASLLMIGPTGVGKTEITKALADFFFSNAARLVRFDMSEFSNELAVQRLVGGTGEKEGLLTSKIREEPFSVVLFDEFEKADKSFFDLLLQVLGDGRLTDSAGRVADFTNSIVVMTSNLGASEFQRGDSGFRRRSREKMVAARHFDSAVKNFLRPEIYNRIDRILPFAPLAPETIRLIARLEIAKLTKRDGIRQRGVGLEISDAAVDLLADGGYDVRYGARPLKRAIERQLLAPLAGELARHSPEDDIKVSVGVARRNLDVRFDVKRKTERRGAESIARGVSDLAELRRRAQRLFVNHRLTALRDEVFRIVKLEARAARGKWMSDAEKARIARKPAIADFLSRTEAFEKELYELEDAALRVLYGNSHAETGPDNGGEAESIFERLLLDLVRLGSDNPDEVTLALFSDHPHSLFLLADIFAGHAASLGGEITAAAFLSSKKPAAADTPVFGLLGRKVHLAVQNPVPKKFSGAPGDVLGILIRIGGDAARARFTGESGMHHFSRAQNPGRVFVTHSDAAFADFVPPEMFARHDSIRLQPPRRTYDFINERVKDAVLDRTFKLADDRLAAVIAEAIELNLVKTTEDFLG